ncbi:Myc-type, basic helix-loop-helix domain-containing protein [Tanacetum coccineum]
MLPNFFQIVNQLYAFIYEMKHSKSGLGLPSIVALVMTIDKSWITISSRNSNAFLDGLLAFIAHYEPLLHPITRKIRCPCSCYCNCDNLVTLKTLEVHISRHGFDQHYTTWKYHGEPILPLPPPVPHSPEHIDMDAFFEDISANNVPTPPTQTTMACVAPRSHGGDAGGSPPRRPTRPVPAQCQSSMLRLETGNRSLRKAFRENNEQPLKIGFDYEDLGTFHPLGNFSGMLNSLIGETVRPLPLACEWEEIPEAYKAHIYPTLESYFNLAEWYNNQDKVVVDSNVYTVGERVRLGLELKLRLLWRKNKNRIKADHYAKHTSPDEAKNHPPPPRVWGDRTQDEWNELVDWWSHPNRVSRSLQNAANRAKNTIITHQGKKSFAHVKYWFG